VVKAIPLDILSQRKFDNFVFKEGNLRERLEHFDCLQRIVT
jgi:hypothetical protein